MGSVKGVAPGFLLLPAREYEWLLQRKVQIRAPLKGKIRDLLGEKALAAGVKIAGEDDFSVFEDDLLLLWELVRVLFAQSQYPALNDDECLNVVALEFEGDEVVIHGEVIKNV